MGKVGGSKRSLRYPEEPSETGIGNLFDTFLKLLFLIDCPFIYPCFANFSLLVEVILWVPKGVKWAFILICIK